MSLEGLHHVSFRQLEEASAIWNEAEPNAGGFVSGSVKYMIRHRAIGNKGKRFLRCRPGKALRCI